MGSPTSHKRSATPPCAPTMTCCSPPRASCWQASMPRAPSTPTSDASTHSLACRCSSAMTSEEQSSIQSGRPESMLVQGDTVRTPAKGLAFRMSHRRRMYAIRSHAGAKRGDADRSLHAFIRRADLKCPLRNYLQRHERCSRPRFRPDGRQPNDWEELLVKRESPYYNASPQKDIVYENGNLTEDPWG